MSTQSNSYSDTELKRLLLAASQGNLHTLQKLLRDDADIDTIGTWGDDSNEDSDQEGLQQWTMLTIAAFHCQISTVKFLLSKGASVDFQPQDGETALMTATHEGHVDVFFFLRKNGADVDRRSFGGVSLLHEAVADVLPKNLEGKIQIIFGLLNKGFPIDTADDEDHTALHHAALIGTRPLVTLLVNGGANINARNRWGDVPLDKAALEGHRKVVKFLLSRGAVINNNAGGCNAGCNALAFAASNGHFSIVALLLSHGARAVPEKSGGLELLCAARMGNARVVHELALRGYMHQVKRALCEAVLIDTAAVVSLLLDLEVAFVNIRNATGSTLLHMAVLSTEWERSSAKAVSNPRTEVIELLLRRGADVKAVNFEGQTAKDFAVAKGYTEAVELLQANEH